MPHIFRRLAVRDGSSLAENMHISESTSNLIVALLALIFASICLAFILFVIRRRKASQKKRRSLLPSHHRNPNRLTITTTPYGRSTESIHVYEEKRNLIANSVSPPASPVPEIRITFPDDEDHAGKRQSGRVVVVRIGESGSVGMEPLHQERLPPYESEDRFQSLDLDRMGGLKEKTELRRFS